MNTRRVSCADTCAIVLVFLDTAIRVHAHDELIVLEWRIYPYVAELRCVFQRGPGAFATERTLFPAQNAIPSIADETYGLFGVLARRTACLNCITHNALSSGRLDNHFCRSPSVNKGKHKVRQDKSPGARENLCLSRVRSCSGSACCDRRHRNDEVTTGRRHEWTAQRRLCATCPERK